jgi:branched-chain amino acid transport system ATP-binding protein
MAEALSARDLRMDFGGLLAVDGVSFAVAEGEILGLIGPNGAGKTTLFNLVSGFLRPRGGRVELGGRDVTGMRPWDLCRLGLARTFQVVRPFPRLTVLGNVAAGAYLRHPHRAAAERAAAEVVELTGLARVAGQEAGALPLPSRKRLEIARALATGPRVLLLDEVVAGLNPSEVEEIIGLIRRLRERGLTIVIVEHIMRVVMGLSDRVVVLNYGRKIAEGPPEAVARDPEVVAAYLGDEGDAGDP